MKKYFKFPGKWGAIILAVFIVVLVGVNIYLYKSSARLEDINLRLEAENHGLSLDLEKSRTIETRLEKEAEEKKGQVRKLDRELAEAIRKYGILKKQTEQVETQKSNRIDARLNGYRKQYEKMALNLRVTLEMVEVADHSLKLCLDKSAKQEKVISFQELAYLECQEQVRIKDLEIEKIRDAMLRLDRFFKRKLLKKTVVRYTIGLLVGVAVGRFLFKSKK